MTASISLPSGLYEKVKQTASRNRQSIEEYIAELVLNDLDEQAQIPTTEDKALAKEAKAWNALFPMLKEKYLGQHVAIYNGKVIDVDPDALTLHRRIRQNYRGKTVWMSQVKQKPFREIQMRSPRLER